MSWKSSSWIMGLRIYREGSTQIFLSSPAMIGPLVRIQDRQGLYWYKNCFKHIIVSFTDHYNAISIDRPPSKTKIGNGSWKRFMKIILLSFPKLQRLLFLLNTQKTTTLQQVTDGNTPKFHYSRKYYNFTRECAFLLKTKKTTSSASVWWGNTKSSFKENARTFCKSSTTHENVVISKPKKDYEICTKRNIRTKKQSYDRKLTKWTLSIRKQASKKC